MLNDPLLPPPPPPSARSFEKNADQVAPTQPGPTRRPTKKPATTAKILVTGLSATAVIGMASGYTLAGKTKAQQINQPVMSPVATVAPTPQPSTQVVTTPATPSADATTPAPVIVVPVPQAAPATPGNASNNWQQQQSSGSR